MGADLENKQDSAHGNDDEVLNNDSNKLRTRRSMSSRGKTTTTPTTSTSTTAASVTPSSIAEFFENRSVFITGGTGFLGKVLIEKLLRSCPGISKVYVLVRPKKKQCAEQRVAELLKSQLFDVLRRDEPQALAKVIGVQGNLVEQSLGLSDEDENLLIRDVSVIFHSAATINFEEPLKNAVAMNLHGTLAIIQLCYKLSNLAALVHLSTAYSNCDRYEAFEKIYPAQQDPEQVLNAASWLSQSVMDQVFQSTKGNKPNTYIYTKALAESLIQKRAVGLPVAIVRPSIVGPTAHEPFPGWIDSPSGPVGLFLISGNGLLRSMLGDQEKRADMVPADYVINVMIAAAWRTATTATVLTGTSRKDYDSDITIYNFASGVENPITWGRLLEVGQSTTRFKYPFETAIMYPSTSLTTNPWVHEINTFLFQVLPAAILDTVARWVGKPPRLMAIQRKVRKTMGAMSYFGSHEWEFHSTNVRKLLNSLSEVDRKMFNFDIKGLVWRDFIEQGILGARTYFMGQNPETIPACVQKMAKLKRLRIVARISSAILLLIFVARLLRLPWKLRPGKLPGIANKAMAVGSKQFA